MMYEKILQKLKSQRGSNNQVTDKTLEAKAKTLESLITTDEILATVDFTDEIASMQGNIGHIASEAVKNAGTEAEKLQAKKAQEEADKLAAEKLALTHKGEEAPEWAKAIIEQNKKNAETLAALQGEKITTTRSEKLNEILKEAPKAFKDQVISNFNQMQFADDDAFNAFTETTKTNFDGFKQLASEQGLSFSTPSLDVKPEPKTKLNPVFEKAFKAKEEEAKAKN